VALGEVLLRALRFSPVSIIPSMLRTYLDRLAALNRRTSRLSLGTFQKAMLFRKSGIMGYKNIFICIVLKMSTDLH
jgi:hypothetical protein